MLEETFLAEITDKLTIKIDNSQDCSNFLQKFIGKVEIVLRKVSKKRSIKQNRWYWGVCIRIIMEETKRITGEEYTKDQIHFYILSKVINIRFKTETIMGETIMRFEIPSTSDMSTWEFMKFAENIQYYFAENKGIYIPDPNEKTYINESIQLL